MTVGGQVNKEDDGFLKVSKFVNSAADLAEGLERDLKKGNRISSDTVLRLNTFKKAAIRAANLLAKLEDQTIKYKN